PPGDYGSAHAEVGVRHRAAARACDQADPRQLGRGRLGTGRGRARAQSGATGRVHEAAQGVTMTDPKARLAELGLELPTVVPPLAAYVPAVRTGNHVYVSGQLPFVDGKLPVTGKVGAEVTEEQAKDLAQRCALNAIAAIDSVVGIDSVVRIVKVVGFVASA